MTIILTVKLVLMMAFIVVGTVGEVLEISEIDNFDGKRVDDIDIHDKNVNFLRQRLCRRRGCRHDCKYHHYGW